MVRVPVRNFSMVLTAGEPLGCIRVDRPEIGGGEQILASDPRTPPKTGQGSWVPVLFRGADDAPPFSARRVVGRSYP